MSQNLYSKIYGTVQEAVPKFKNPEDALSFYLEGAAKYLTKASLAAQEERFEDRSNHSDKALMIFNGILSYLEQSPSEEKKAVQSLMEYCRLMNGLIVRMNIKNDITMAENLAKEVKNMSNHWRERSEITLNQETTERGSLSELDKSTQQITMANPATPYPSSQREKTAVFSA